MRQRTVADYITRRGVRVFVGATSFPLGAGRTLTFIPTGRLIQRRRWIDDKPGTVYGRLTLLRPASKTGKVKWWVQCECGTEVIVSRAALRAGNTRSCGCAKRDLTQAMGRANRTHGGSQTPEYAVWRSLLARCNNPKAPNFADYGGRGIRVCARWTQSFAAFVADMGPRPASVRRLRAEHSIDRRDNNGDYTPDNCRWVVGTVQNSNKRTNRWITFHGERRTLTQWARHLQINIGTLRGRLERGWSVERTLQKRKTP